ncbi:MAG: stage II sporulation protein M [Candidatus Pacearchaeota archaeon]|jgi:stage II sporulation protein M
MKAKKSVKTKVNSDNYIYSSFKFGLRYIKNLKNYIGFVSLFFLLITFFGFIFPYFFREQIIKIIADLLKQTEGLGTLELISFIITNNIKTAFFGMVLGIFFGVVSLGIIIVNGYVLGFIAKETVGIEGFSVLFRLVPHGIFEIPAIIISLALGLKLGMFLFTYKGKDKPLEFLKWLSDSVKVFVFIIIPLLVIAGIIEGILIMFVG